MRQCIAEGTLIACDVVWAEVAAGFRSALEADAQLESLGVGFSSLDRDAALTAGERFAEYRRRGGKRTRVIADFLIAAHPRHHAERLLTRDRGFHRAYFSDLVVLDSAG